MEVSSIKSVGGPVCAIAVSDDGTEALAGTLNGIVRRVKLGDRTRLTRTDLESSILSESHCDCKYIELSLMPMSLVSGSNKLFYLLRHLRLSPR